MPFTTKRKEEKKKTKKGVGPKVCVEMKLLEGDY